MAIYSFNHDTFGKTTNRAGAAGGNAAYNSREDATRLEDSAEAQLTAADNAAYNAREEAVFAIRSYIIPSEARAAEAWFREQEKGERKNARMSDRFIAALPRELTPEQCIEAVEGFCRAVTGDRIPWHFALHLELEKKNDADWNPHTHIIFRDRDIETGRRVLYTSAGPKERRELDAKGIDYWTTKDFRVAWNDHVNRALEHAGHEARVDHRSLKEQGIDREPGIHVGPASRNAAEKGHAFESRDIEIGSRTIAYSIFDEGTRADYAARIKAENDSPQLQPTTPRAHGLQRDLQRLREGQRESRLEQREEQGLDRDALRKAHAAEIRMHRAWAKSFATEERRTGQSTSQEIKAVTAAAWAEMQVVHGVDRKDLQEAHRLESTALIRAHAAERLAVVARSGAESVQGFANLVVGETRAGMAAQQSAAHRHMRMREAARASPLARARNMTATANSEHDLAEAMRSKLDAQRQSNQLVAREPEAQAGRAMVALRRVTADAQQEQGDRRQARRTPLTVLDAKTRADHVAAEQRRDAQEQASNRSTLTRAQADEQKALGAEQSQDRSALATMHAAERQQQAAKVKAQTTAARQAASKDIRTAMQTRWKAVRAIPDKTERAAAAQALMVEQKVAHSVAAEGAIAKVRTAVAPARIAMQALHVQDRKHLADAHALETSALTRVHVTERLAAHTREPTIAARAAAQRDTLRELRASLNAHRRTCRFMAGTGQLSHRQASRAIVALRNAVVEEQQRQQRASAVARGQSTDADRTNAPPESRAQADRITKTRRERRIEAVLQSTARSEQTRKGGGRGR